MGGVRVRGREWEGVRDTQGGRDGEGREGKWGKQDREGYG